MTDHIVIHFDNFTGLQKPRLILKQGESVSSLEAHGNGEFGLTFSVEKPTDAPLVFKFGDPEHDQYEGDHLWRSIPPHHLAERGEFWCRGWNAFVYVSQPAVARPEPASDCIEQLDFADGVFISDTGGRFGLGANPLTDGGISFGLFHPHAARVFVAGDFNDWQRPGVENADPQKFLELALHLGYFGTPNVWLLKVDQAKPGALYQFYVEYDTLAGEHVMGGRLAADPYARFLGDDYERNDGLVVNPAAYEWHDGDYQTPLIHELVIYELHVHGFTHGHPDIDLARQGRYAGIIDRMEAGYFDKLGITCLYLMPISEVPTPQGEDALGYNTSLFMSVERDFGTPDELRELVDTAHRHGLAVIIDQVFNHSANNWNPLWKFILDHPSEDTEPSEGGLYFSGESPWGNRVATERAETQNMLIDACKLMIREYHIDGFRFDATHTNYMDHGFLHRLADELQAFKPDVILIAENLPNQSELNRQGYNGFGQWNDFFHDTMKAFLREGRFEGTDDHPEHLGDVFYFSKAKFAAHTNNVVNYCESHDEHSVAHEVGFVEELNSFAAKDRKARLGLFATIVALGQPMIYMGQELCADRSRNLVYFDFPESLDEHGFYQWASRLIKLRRTYPGLKLHGFNPIEDGQFHWLLGPWFGERAGGGKRVLGWRSTPPTDNPSDALVIMLNFENHAVDVDVDFGGAGNWVCLASIDFANDLPPHGTASVEDPTTIRLDGPVLGGFILPASSAFIYKWEG
jgi:1,4-alpha-glucan branching enzyme